FINTQEDGETSLVVFGGPPSPVTNHPTYDTRPEDVLNAFAALREMDPDIRINGHPQNLFEGKLEALWANVRTSPLMLAPGEWLELLDNSETEYRRRLAEVTATAP
ncbi:MAG: hypothetical protein MK009_00030, partial [Gammaproteobacteria bacterium]|nr:hypothetical protein [Gammaproteobacteria bacterium]